MSLPIAQRSTPARPLAWASDDGVYTLAQLVHPLHILEEGIAQHNCMRYLQTDKASVRKVQVPPEQARELVYWKNIESRQYSYYSFGRDDQPLVTIEVRHFKPFPAVTQICRRGNRAIKGSEPYFLMLVRAMNALDEQYYRHLVVLAHLTELAGARPLLPIPRMSLKLLQQYHEAIP